MKAWIRVADEPDALEWQDWPDPEAGAGEVLVRIERAAVCSTDVAIWSGLYRGRQPNVIPAMVGHEAAGVVEYVNGTADGVQIGDRVTLQVIWGHPQSWESVNGQENLDPDWYHLGTWKHPGAFAELIATNAEHVVKLPDEIEWDDGALVEALSIAANAMELVRLQPGEAFVAVGPGTFGLLCAQIARASGAGAVVVVGLKDVDEARLAVAEKVGADHVLVFDGDAAATAATLRSLTRGRGADVVIDNGGTPTSTPLALELAAAGGRVALTGFAPTAEIEPLRQIIRKGLVLYGVAASQRRHYGPALRMIEGGLHPSEIISHHFSFDRADEAVSMMRSREATKVLLVR